MNCRPLLFFLGIVCLGRAASAEEEISKHALLVGCTAYLNPDIAELAGPANDVPLFAGLLRKKFGFQQQHIVQLVGWPEEESRRPTYANIKAAFESLVAKSKPNTQIVILMNGHGVQLPIPEDQTDALDPSNPEEDGYDEAFLPADAKKWSSSGVENVILDNEMKLWLDAMKARGASVWIVFDCCHSATMTRSVEDVERHRGLNAWDLGVPADVLRSATRKASASATESRGAGADGDPLTLGAEKESGGSVTAFFAAQAYETAPELPRPKGAPRSPEHYHGLLTYTLVEALEQASGHMSYRDLARRTTTAYRSERGSRDPTPFFSGDMDREVMSFRDWPKSPIYLEQVDNTPRLSAGKLLGLTRDSILAVHPPGGEGEAGKVLAHVKLTRLTPTNSEVESVAFGGLEAVELADLPNQARCTVVHKAMGDMRISVAIAGIGENVDKTLHQNLRQALQNLPEETAGLTKLTERESDADWILRLVSPREAQELFDLQIERPQVLLLSANGQQEVGSPTDASAGQLVPGNVTGRGRKICGRYDAEDTVGLATSVSSDLKKIFTWQNIWRIAAGLEAEQTGDDLGFKFEVTVGVKETPAEHLLRPGDRITLNIENEGFDDLWVTLMYLDADYGIHTLFSSAIKAQKKLPAKSYPIDDSSVGAEGFVVFVVPTSVQRQKPDYSFLEQSPFGVRSRDLVEFPNNPSPFQSLMMATKAQSEVRTRGLGAAEPTNPQIFSWTWVTQQAKRQ